MVAQRKPADPEPYVARNPTTPAVVTDPTDPKLRQMERKLVAQRDELSGLRKKLTNLDR